MLLRQRGDHEQALLRIREALSHDPDNLHAIIFEARLLIQLQQPEQAFDRIEQALAQSPNDRRLRLHYARMLMSQDLPAAQAQFEQLLANRPNDADLLLTLALISKERELLEDSKDYFSRLLNTGRHRDQAHLSLAQLAELQQQWHIALHHYQQVSAGKLFLRATNGALRNYLQLDQLDQARLYMAELRQQQPELGPQLYLFESELLMREDRYQEGMALLTEALLRHPQQDSLLYARSMFSEKLGDIDLLERDLRTMLDHQPDNPLALNALGYALANHSDRYQEARELISKALQLKPGDPAITDSLGWVEYRLGRLERALELLQQAFKDFPDHEVAAHLGEVLWQLGRRDEARAIWQRGLELKPDSPLIREAMQRLTGAAP